MEDNDTADDNGYETDQDHVHDLDQQEQNIIITDEEYLLLKTFILETTKPNAYKLSKIYNPDVESIRQLFIQIVQHNLIKYYQLHPDFTKKPYNDGSITIHAYLHLLEIDNRMYELLSPRITKEDYDAIDALYPGVKSVDYGCKFIESIKFSFKHQYFTTWVNFLNLITDFSSVWNSWLWKKHFN